MIKIYGCALLGGALIFDRRDLGKDVIPTKFGSYTENIYFPTNRSAPSGEYMHGITGGPEIRELAVYLGDETLALHNGTGPSEDYYFIFSTCVPSEDMCCIDQDCQCKYMK